MTDLESDEPMRERFRALRAATEQAGAPDFRAMLDRAHGQAATATAAPVPLRAPRRRLLRAAGWAGAAAAAALAAVLLVGERAGADADAEFERLVSAYASDPAAGAWRSPTSALLDLPGSALVRSLPSVGGALGEGL